MIFIKKSILGLDFHPGLDYNAILYKYRYNAVVSGFYERAAAVMRKNSLASMKNQLSAICLEHEGICSAPLRHR